MLLVLTRAFVSDLRQLDDRPLVLIFDRAEEAQPEVQRWLMDMPGRQLARLPHVCVWYGDKRNRRAATRPFVTATRWRRGDEEEYVRFCRTCRLQ
ncbi:MAG: hypothetical protein R2911_31245 [Caldilineaceae bacterium]